MQKQNFGGSLLTSFRKYLKISNCSQFFLESDDFGKPL
jgi:hypothetical protein